MRLPVPVKRALREPISEQVIAQMWTRIDEAGERVRARSRRTTRAVSALAFAGACAALALAVWTRGTDFEHPAPVALATGDAWGRVNATEAQTVALDDGSRLELAVNAEVEPVAEPGTAVGVRQPHGAVVYDVTAQRPWIIHSGAVSIDVVSSVMDARFQVEADAHHVHVAVERGLLIVRSVAIPGGVARLGPAMDVDVATGIAADTAVAAVGSVAVAATATASAPADGSVAGSASEPAPRTRHAAESTSRSTTGVVPAVVPPPPAPPWRDLAAHGANDEAYASLGSGGVTATARTASVDELFELADVARLSGHAAEAVEPLQHVVEAFPDDPRSPLAALTLGRVQLRSLDAPGPAARTLDIALARGIPADLVEDASALRIEALARSGQLDAARTAYARFTEQFPRSARARALSSWLGDR